MPTHGFLPPRVRLAPARWPATLLALCAGLTLATGTRAPAADPFELRDGDRVVFLGDTFFEREGVYGHIEARLTAAFPDRTVTYRNLS